MNNYVMLAAVFGCPVGLYALMVVSQLRKV
jgi:hypothetical protein